MNRNFLKVSSQEVITKVTINFSYTFNYNSMFSYLFFYDRHWDKIVNRFSNIASNKINLIINTYKKTNFDNAKNIATTLNISLTYENSLDKSLSKKSILEKNLRYYQV